MSGTERHQRIQAVGDAIHASRCHHSWQGIHSPGHGCATCMAEAALSVADAERDAAVDQVAVLRERVEALADEAVMAASLLRKMSAERKPGPVADRAARAAARLENLAFALTGEGPGARMVGGER